MVTDCLDQALLAGSSSTWVLSNHDVVRHTSRFGLPAGADFGEWLMSDGREPMLDEATGLRRARAATLFMLALPGSAYLYQGEELGLHEVSDLPAAALQDPIWLRTGNTLKGRDGCRVPLPWDADGDSYGFGSGGGWLPQPAGFAPLSVARQLGDPDSTLELYRRALRLRHELQTEEALEWMATDSPDVLHFARPGRLALRDELRHRPGRAARRHGPCGQRPAPRRRPPHRDDRLAHPRLTPPAHTFPRSRTTSSSCASASACARTGFGRGHGGIGVRGAVDEDYAGVEVDRTEAPFLRVAVLAGLVADLGTGEHLTEHAHGFTLRPRGGLPRCVPCSACPTHPADRAPGRG